MALTDENGGGFVATMPMAPAYGGGFGGGFGATASAAASAAVISIRG